jgi:hypothetical protein
VVYNWNEIIGRVAYLKSLMQTLNTNTVKGRPMFEKLMVRNRVVGLLLTQKMDKEHVWRRRAEQNIELCV